MQKTKKISPSPKIKLESSPSPKIKLESSRKAIFDCIKNHNLDDIHPSKYQPIKVLDLFSGIGGFSLALRGITETIAFCEIDWACQQVLHRHHGAVPIDIECVGTPIPRGLPISNPKFLTQGENKENNKPPLDKNPKIRRHEPFLFKDIHSITDKMISKYKVLKDVEMITAGFPCTDISVANYKGDGIDGDASGLFFEILRLIDLLPSIKFVFLENSPNIRLKGLTSIVDHFKKRGFSCYWTYVCASDVGAYHKRKRWFCLCMREVVESEGRMNTFNRLKPVHSDNILKYKWAEDESRPRILHKDDLTLKEKREHIHRCRMLGNSIVPQAAAYAWNTLLCHIFSHHFSDRSKYLSNNLIPDSYMRGSPSESKPSVDSSPRFSSFSPFLPSHSHPSNSLMQASSSKPRADFVSSPPPLIDNYIDIYCTDGNKSFTKTRWVTPNYSIWHMFSHIGSLRCNTTLTVQILFDKSTVIREKNRKKSDVFNRYVCNAPFIEHLMGYPNNWTKFKF